jgi:aldehyde:ferredoxin oxidoreductase
LFERLRGRPFSEQEILDIGERVWNLGRLFNLREGVEADGIPVLLCESSASSLGTPRKSIGQEALDAALQEYYKLRGWNEHGVPSEERLAMIGVDVRLSGA